MYRRGHRARAAFAVALWAGLLSSARAETVVVSEETVLHRRPGDKAAAVADLQPGAELRVLGRRGRWIEVRAGKERGWIARTLVRPAEPPAHAEPKPTAWGAERLRALRAGDRAPRTIAHLLADVGETASGQPQSRVDETALRAATSETNPASRSTDGIGAVRRYVGLRLGMQSLSMSYRSDGSTALASYRITARALVAELTAGLPVTRPSRRVHVELEGAYRVGHSSPGIRYVSSSGESGDIAFSTTEARIAVVGGMRVGNLLGGTTLAVAGGYHYSAFLPSDLENHGKLPREDLRGLLAGLRLRLADVGGGTTLAADLDLLVGGQRGQTKGGEDGNVDRVDALWTRVALVLPLGRSTRVQGSYGYGRAFTAWSGASARQPDISVAERDDREHLVTIGLRCAR